MEGRVQRTDRLTADAVREVLGLAQEAADLDGACPLAEHVVLHLRHGGDPPAVHLLARDAGAKSGAGSEPRGGSGGAGRGVGPGKDPDRASGRLTGYAHVDTTDAVAGAAAELVVRPDARRRGLGRALVRAAVEVAGERDPRGRLRLWAHGDHPGAAALAQGMGFTRARVLHQLRRPLSGPVPEPALPAGVELRPFRPGADDAAWLAVNARAFADHPEQGAWTSRDLQLRMAEPWFDPAGFLLAVREGMLLGFHWTKVHGDAAGSHQHEPIGEVYVLGVDPAAHGLGLGTALTLAGLRYLQGRGLDQVMLYVDESNTAAMALYLKLGFARWSVDVTFARTTEPS